MEQQDLTLLIMAAECSDIVWVPIASSEELLMDYAIRFAVEAGCINVVVTVCEAQKDAALEHMKKIGQKYSVSTAAITVDSRYNGSVNQIVAAEKEFSNSNYIVMNASCYFEKEAFETAARNLLEFHSSCMIGDMPKVELPHSKDKRYFTPYVRSIWWDWRVKKNMFGFTAEAVKMIVDRYKIELDLEDQGPKQVKYDSLEAKIPDIMRLDHEFITDEEYFDIYAHADIPSQGEYYVFGKETMSDDVSGGFEFTAFTGELIEKDTSWGDECKKGTDTFGAIKSVDGKIIGVWSSKEKLNKALLKTYSSIDEQIDDTSLLTVRFFSDKIVGYYNPDNVIQR